MKLRPSSTGASNTSLQEQVQFLQRQLDEQAVFINEQVDVINEQSILIDEEAQIIDKKADVIGAQKKRIAILEEYLRLANQKRFGASSEKNLFQGELFNEAELLGDGDSDASGEIETDPAADEEKPKKKRTARKGLSAALPRVQVYHPLTDEEKQGALDTFFVMVKEELDIVPAVARVIEHLQEKAVFVDGEGSRSLKVATRPPHPLGKAIASISLLSYLIISKYADGLPLYRLEGILKRYGGEITRTTMANWIIRLSKQVQPVVNLLEEEMFTDIYMQGDETRMQVLKEPGTEATSTKHMWIMRGGAPDKTVVMFNYDKSRGKAVAERLLEGFEGKYFQSDGYAGYDGVCKAKGITHLGCWDHARRKFIESARAAPKAKKSAKPSIAHIAVSKIDALYRIERKIETWDDEQKRLYRQEHSVPKLAALKLWLEEREPKVDRDSKTGKAIRYTLNQWEKLVRYCEHGALNISNVLAENAIRPFVIGRKAWLFADTPDGARASAIFYTLIETAKANKVDPYEYLHYLISGIATSETVEGYEALLPWNMKQHTADKK